MKTLLATLATAGFTALLAASPALATAGQERVQEKPRAVTQSKGAWVGTISVDYDAHFTHINQPLQFDAQTTATSSRPQADGETWDLFGPVSGTFAQQVSGCNDTGTLSEPQFVPGGSQLLTVGQNGILGSQRGLPVRTYFVDFRVLIDTTYCSGDPHVQSFRPRQEFMIPEEVVLALPPSGPFGPAKAGSALRWAGKQTHTGGLGTSNSPAVATWTYDLQFQPPSKAQRKCAKKKGNRKGKARAAAKKGCRKGKGKR